MKLINLLSISALCFLIIQANSGFLFENLSIQIKILELRISHLRSLLRIKESCYLKKASLCFYGLRLGVITKTTTFGLVMNSLLFISLSVVNCLASEESKR